MDEIDITDSTFSLNNNFDTNAVLSGGDGEAKSFYMYAAIAVGVLVLCYILYTTFAGKGKRVTFQDKLEQCYGDVCYPSDH
jgi:hypothetical protein